MRSPQLLSPQALDPFCIGLEEWAGTSLGAAVEAIGADWPRHMVLSTHTTLGGGHLFGSVETTNR